MLVVLDTNIIIASLSSFSKYHWIIRKLMDQEYNIAFTGEIILEYEEKIIEKYSIETARNFLSFLKEMPNGKLTSISYKWNLIHEDPDDNKFSDCAIASRSDYIVTEDKHFNVLKSVDFPKLSVIGIKEFGDYLQGNS